jgi:hypothetical protein
VPEQEFLPPRRPAGFPGNPDVPRGYQDEDPPPWAGLPSVRPSRPAPGYPMGSWPTAAPPPPRGQEPVPDWAGPDAAAEDDAPPPYVPPGTMPYGSGPPGSAPPGSVPPGSVPPWSEPPRDEPRAPGGRVLGGRARAAARRRRRWLIMIAGLVVVAGGVTAAIVVPGGPAPAPVTPDGLITTFQPGELQTVPDACGTVPAATVQHYLPGPVKQASPLPINGSAGSACDWTVDDAPVYRLLELNLLAYAPSGLASGDGSATYAAIDAYSQTLQALQDPSSRSAEPKATISTLNGLGNEAFSATQVFRRGGAVTDVASVVVRYHNVVVSVTLNGLEHSNRGSYGPVSMSDLSSAALAFAQAAEAALH